MEIDPPLALSSETVERFYPEAASRLNVVLEDAARVTDLPGDKVLMGTRA